MKNKKIIDIMLDLETLAPKENAAIIQIAAVACDLTTGKTFEEFNELVNPQSSVNYGLTIDGETVAWWLSQDKEVVKKVFSSSISKGKDLKDTLQQLSKFIENVKKNHKTDKILVWGNGILADNRWLETAYLKTEEKQPWNFWEDQDVRTLVELGRRKYGIDPKKTLKFKGNVHNAIDDCKHQIRYCSAILKHKG